ncbi:MAG: uridine kinase [Acidimicrobiia bacterium]|nr:uridine kinase [Acidimicrobiia bacterium]
MAIDITVSDAHHRWPTDGEDRPLIIGMAGGSGSGKTTIAEAVVETVGEDLVSLIKHDAYYRDLGHVGLEDRIKVNFDHPDSLETELLIEHLQALRAGRSIERPVYDFSTHTRTDRTVRIDPERVVIIEGILVLAEPELRELMDLRIYVDTDSDLRLLRRLQRDLIERGRTVESVIDQYLSTVRPMHLQFVEISKRYADLIVPEGYNPGVVGTVTSLIRDFLATR